MVVLDTSIIIDHLRQSSKKDTALLKIAKQVPKESLALSVVSVQELYEGTSTRNHEQENYLLATITPLIIISYTYEIARVAGAIARDRTRSIEFADSAIAASVIVNGGELATLNTKDFVDIPELVLFDFD